MTTDDSLHDPRNLNLQEVGKQAGVSRSTVSRVINNDPNVSKRTRERVLKVIDRLGYRPHFAARALVTQRTQVVGVIIPKTINIVFEDRYYFPTLLTGIASVINQRDYTMVLWIEEDETDQERFYRNIVQSRLIDGLIIASMAVNNPFLLQVAEMSVPLVMIEKPEGGPKHFSYVTIDNVSASREITDHLIRLGRQRIGTVTGDLKNADGIDRYRGYCEALRASPLGLDETLVYEGKFAFGDGYDGAKVLLARGVDAIVTGNDQTAFGAVEAVHELGLRVPEDVAVVGFDDLPTAARSKPPLTTVHQPIRERGAAAAQLLLEQIEGQEQTPKHLVLPTRLVVRQSCGATPPVV
jgi:LacI family transcriptional regulator